MFTGIVREKADILGAVNTDGCEWHIKANFSPQLKIGDSIAINGVCHTVTWFDKISFKVFSSKETLAITSLKHLKIGSQINLERAIKIGDRLDGHLVYGHVDCTSRLINIEKGENSYLLIFQMKEDWSVYLISKGSITIDGISLTIYQKNEDSFSVMIVPHTWKNTNLQYLNTNDLVNIELDVVAKYLKNFNRPLIDK